MDTALSLEWTLGHAAREDEPPQRWVPATVPGAVQLDWARAEGWPPFYVAEEPKRYRWMEDAWWTYRTTLTPPALGPDDRLVLTCRGIDYHHRVIVGRALVHEQEGMFTPVQLDLTEQVQQGSVELRVVVFPAPKRPGRPDDRTQASLCCKPAVSYGWDFHPRLIPLGIWDELTVSVRRRGWIRRTSVRSTLSAALDRAEVACTVELSERSDTTLRWRLVSPTGETLAEQSQPAGADVTFHASVDRPALWWPHDQGEQPLYTSIVDRLDASGQVIETQTRRVGIRRVRLVMNAGAWKQPEGFPKSRSVPPITLEINGRRIFGKGANWVSPDIFPGTITAARYRDQLNLVRSANMNLLRMWGGAPAQKEAFYDICDELGILVWQEFPLACNDYEDDPHYLQVLDRESTSLIRRLREHACLVIWCGGNELFNFWSGMTEQSLPLRLLGRNCYDLDPLTPFIPTSPLMGMGHGHYVFRDTVTGEDVWQIFQRGRCSAYTEFGVPSPAPMSVIETFLPDDQRFPPRQDGSWVTHHAYGAWGARKTSHFYPDVIEHYFGPSDSLEQLVERGLFLQAEGYRGVYEEIRRQQPYASMALSWCLNEPWPTLANNALIAWPCAAKPALRAVGEALRPMLASARIARFDWCEGDLFEAQLWMLSDAPRACPAGAVTATLTLGDRTFELLTWRFDDLPPQTNLRGPTTALQLPRAETAHQMELRLDVEGRPELGTRYTLMYRPLQRRQATGTRVMNA